jgi:hypothetical protein
VRLQNPLAGCLSVPERRDPWYDCVDWIGGYPFEVAKPEEIFSFYRARSFQLLRLKTCAGSLGCNEFVFQKKSR